MGLICMEDRRPVTNMISGSTTTMPTQASMGARAGQAVIGAPGPGDEQAGEQGGGGEGETEPEGLGDGPVGGGLQGPEGALQNQVEGEPVTEDDAAGLTPGRCALGSGGGGIRGGRKSLDLTEA